MSWKDHFKVYGTSINSSGTRSIPITPDDDNDLAIVPRALYVANTGFVSMVLMDDDELATPEPYFLAAGVPHPLRPRRVYATGTDFLTGIKGVE